MHLPATPRLCDTAALSYGGLQPPTFAVLSGNKQSPLAQGDSQPFQPYSVDACLVPSVSSCLTASTLSVWWGVGVQDELLNIIYWWRQVAGVLLGLVIGFMGITGFMGFSM